MIKLAIIRVWKQSNNLEYILQVRYEVVVFDSYI